MAAHSMRRILAAAAAIILVTPFFAFTQSSPQETLKHLDERREKAPQFVLDSLAKGENRFSRDKKTQRYARFIRAEAMLYLQHHGEAETVYRKLLTELTADAESEPLLTARTALGLGNVLTFLSRPSEAEAALTLAARQLPPDAPPEIHADILLEMTRALIFLGEPVNAADKATEAIEWATRHHLDRFALQARYLLGYTYRNRKKIAEARTHFLAVLQDARRMGELRYEVMAMNELGNLLVMENKTGKALQIKQEALAKAQAAGDDYLISICQHDIGYALIARRQYDRALEIYREIIRRETQRNNPRAIHMARLNLSYIYVHMGRRNEALRIMRQSLAAVREIKLGEVELKILDHLIELLEQGGRFQEALQYQKELAGLNEQIFQRELERKITEIRDRYRLLEQESEIRILRQDKEIRNLQLGRQRILILSMIGLAFFLALLAGVAFFGYRAKRSANNSLEALNRRLDELARRDALTNLSNRRDLLEKLEMLKARADRDQSPLSMLMIDMDHFKAINDHWGHEQGDRVLQSVAGTLKDRIRGQDLLARWGGEEFLVVMADTNREGALRAAELLRRQVETSDIHVDNQKVPLTITIGVAQYQPGEDPQAAITRADNRLYEGKNAGRNRVAG